MSKATEFIEELRKLFKQLIISMQDLARRAGDKGGKRIEDIFEKAGKILRWVFPDGSILRAEIFTKDCLSHNHTLMNISRY